METTIETNIPADVHVEKSNKRPVVFEYMNFRTFLKEGYEHIKSKNSAFSESAFIRKAGYGATSRGYLTLILKGKRNLSAKGVLGFAQALKLNKKETEYFEALVFFNQAKDQKDKQYYFDKITKLAKGKETNAYKILKGQFNICSKWYLIAVRELISLSDFVNDAKWISERLRNKVTKSQVEEAIEDLINIGMIKNIDGKLYQNDEFLSLDNEIANNEIVTNYHKDMMDKTKEYLDEDDYKHRSASSITFTCAQSDFPQIREEIASFRETIINKYGLSDSCKESALHMGIQLIQLTQPTSTTRNK